MKNKEVSRLLYDVLEKCRSECECVENRRRHRISKQSKEEGNDLVGLSREEDDHHPFFYDAEFKIAESAWKEDEWALRHS